MLSVYPPVHDSRARDFNSTSEALWVDLLDPTPEETASVSATLGEAVPAEWSLTEIEPSSRLRIRNDVLFMSTPTATHRRTDGAVVAPIGFVLSKDRIVTVRYTPMSAFDAVAAKFEPGRSTPKTSLDVFDDLIDEISDHVADALEEINVELSDLSIEAFQKDHLRGRDPNRSTQLLQKQLRQLGRIGDRLSDIRNGLLGVARVVNFVEQFCADWTGGVARPRLVSLRNDVSALSEYEEHLASKTQFVLDAIVGLISIAQNDIFKVLTIVSIVGIPPTLMAGVYGMNFEHMPELHWAWGYEWGLGVIIVSAIIPLIWFKLKGWF
jgi:magnesium transporter